jgi:ribosome-associated protein
MFAVTEQFGIPDDEFQWTFVRAGGPGGQNVNKVASRAVLRWNLSATESLPAAVKSRLLVQQHRRISGDGDLIVTSQRWRDQERNRQDCLEKLRAMLIQAATAPKPRKPTRATRGSKERRLAAKRRRSAVKQQRRLSGED